MSKLQIMPAFKACGLLLALGALAGFTPIAAFNMGTSESFPHSGIEADNANNCHCDPSISTTEYMAIDRNIVRQIRRSIQSDRSLSNDAHYIQIISDKGKVTLSGRVQSEAESRDLEADAEDVVGMGGVINDLSTKGNTPYQERGLKEK